MIQFLNSILLQYSITGFLLCCIAYKRKNHLPIIAALLLFSAFIFDTVVLHLPKLGIFSHLHWNWQGKMVEFAWPFIIIYVFKWLSPAECGLVMPKTPLLPVIFLGILLVLCGIGASFFFGWHAQKSINMETILYQLTMPGLAEEIVFRGIFFAILNRYFEKPWTFLKIKFGWSAILVTILFTSVHCIIFNKMTHAITFDLNLISLLLGFILILVREKTGSIWPAVLLHNMCNGLYFILQTL